MIDTKARLRDAMTILDQTKKELSSTADDNAKLSKEVARLVAENATLRLGWTEFQAVGVAQEERIARLAGHVNKLISVFSQPVCPDQLEAVMAARDDVPEE